MSIRFFSKYLETRETGTKDHELRKEKNRIMKKQFYLSIAMILLVFTSCKKVFTCNCTTTINYSRQMTDSNGDLYTREWTEVVTRDNNSVTARTKKEAKKECGKFNYSGSDIEGNGSSQFSTSCEAEKKAQSPFR